MAVKKTTKSVDEADEWSGSAQLTGFFNISISGTWDARVTVQRSFDEGSTWYDVAKFTENVQEYGFEPEDKVYYRAGCKAGEFGTGTVHIRLSQ